MNLKIAVVGATGLVGTEMLTVLAASNLGESEIIPVASEKSIGKKILFKNKEIPVIGMEEALSLKPHIALFSAGGSTSLQWAPAFAQVGTFVIDNSSAWRMDPNKKLIVPEINRHLLNPTDRIIANPNCSTIQMVLALKPIHDLFGLKRVVVSTYQSVTGTGVKAVQQLMDERNGRFDGPKAYPHTIDMNIIPHIDVFQENGYTKEEMKMILESRKILGLPNLRITATTVRIPVIGGHSESVNIETEQPFDLQEIYAALETMPGIVIQDKPLDNVYPMPLFAKGKNEVFVGRIRRDESVENGLNMWIVADNLRKGAATNAVQIGEYLAESLLTH